MCWPRIWFRKWFDYGSEESFIWTQGFRRSIQGPPRREVARHWVHTTHADPDVWRRPDVKPDSFEYYEYILCYVDDLLAISHDAQKVLKSVQDTFKFKDDKIDKPDVYLGAQLDKMSVDGFEGWTMSSEKYVKSAIENIEQTLAESSQRLPTKC